MKSEPPPPALKSFEVNDPACKVLNLPLECIKPDPEQPRKFFRDLEPLAESLLKNGQLQPILVRPCEVDGCKFMIVHGERRYRASKLAGIKTIDCIIKEVTLVQVRDLQLIENVERDNLLDIELAVEFQKRIDAGQTQEQIAKAIGKSRGFVEQRLALLRLPSDVQELLKEDKITFSRARDLLAYTASNGSVAVSKSQQPDSKKIIDTPVSMETNELIDVQSLALGKLLTSKTQVTRSELWLAFDKDVVILRGGV